MSTSSLILTSKVVKSKDGSQIFAEACGDPSKQAVVFVHGFACASTVFDKIFALPEFQNNLFLESSARPFLRCRSAYQLLQVRYEPRGHARSEKPETEEAYESSRYAEDFDAVCKAFKVKEPFFAGWSLAGAIAADICASHQHVPIKGIIWLAAVPYLGDILPIVASPLVLSFVPGLTAPESAAHALKSRIEFCETLLAPNRLHSIPFADFSGWVGAAAHMPPQCGALLLGRKQDPTRLKEEGAKGLPLCIIYGSADLQLFGEKVVEQMRPHFKDCETHSLEGVGHILFWEEPEAVADIITKFAARVNQR